MSGWPWKVMGGGLVRPKVNSLFYHKEGRRNREMMPFLAARLSNRLRTSNTLGSLIRTSGDIHADAIHRIKAGWANLRQDIGILCNK